MATPAKDILNRMAQDLGLSEDDLLKQGLRCFLEQQLRKTNADTFEICGRYGVKNVSEMELHYKDGSLKESESWTNRWRDLRAFREAGSDRAHFGRKKSFDLAWIIS